MAVNFNTEIGSTDDTIEVRIDGERWTSYESYSIKRAVLTQPSTASFTTGNSGNASALLSKLRPGLEVSIKVGSTGLFSGFLEDPGASVANGTSVTVDARDGLAFMMREDVRDEKQLSAPTYFALVRKLMDLSGLKDHNLYSDNDANRAMTSRVPQAAPKPKQLVESIELPRPGNQGAKLQYQTVKCELGQSYFDLAMSQLKRVGIYVWCAGNGDLIVSRPTMPTQPIIQIDDLVGLSRNSTNIISCELKSRISGRHAHCRVYGRGYPDNKGVRAIKGEFDDQEMIALGFDNWRVVHDSEATSPLDCKYIAKRVLAEERRQSRVLSYTLAGHTIPAIDNSRMVVWIPDIAVKVVSNRLAFPGEPSGINEDLYVESVEFARNPQTTTKINLMRKQDLLYLGEKTDFEDDSPIPVSPKVKRRKK
jgi:prophage tail gpP-like protein